MPCLAATRTVGVPGALEELEKFAWYLHHTPEDRFYFDHQENLTNSSRASPTTRPENQMTT